jgi:partner of Y14 and mago protein
VIPGSRRPDGTVRKEIKVREGYVPPEDVRKFTSRFTEDNDKPSTWTGGVVGVAESAHSGAAASGGAKSKSQKKNEKRRQKKQQESPPA